MSSDYGISWDRIFPRYEIKNDDDKKFWGSISSSDFMFRSGHFLDSLNGFLNGSSKFVLTKKSANITFTTDGGKTWNFSDNKLILYNSSFISKNLGFAIGLKYDDTFILFKTKDGGMYWDSIGVFPKSGDYLEKILNNNAKQIIFPDSSTGYLIKRSSHLKTSDSINYPYGYKSVSTLFRTMDYCKSFDSVYSKENISTFGKIQFTNKNLAVIKSGKTNLILKTTDGCKTWKELLLPGIKHYITDVYFIDENFGLATGRQDTIFTTYDGGDSWKMEVLPFNRHFSGDSRVFTYDFYSGIQRAMNGNIFLLGRGRVIRGIIDSTTIGVDDKQTEGGVYCPYYYITVVPNPVVGNVKINLYGLHYAQNQKISLKLYDINGYFVKDLSQEANRNNNGKTGEFQTNLQDLPAGIYFIQMEVNNLIRSQKFIKY